MFVWKNELAETAKCTPLSDSVMWSRPSSRCSSLPTATLAFLALTLSTTLAVAGVRSRSASATGIRAATSGAEATTLTMAWLVRRPSRRVRKRSRPRSVCWSHTDSARARI